LKSQKFIQIWKIFIWFKI